jgi:hypothetical protein
MIINLLVAVVCSLVLGIGIVHAAEPDPAVLKHLKQLNAEVKSAFQGGDYERLCPR